MRMEVTLLFLPVAAVRVASFTSLLRTLRVRRGRVRDPQPVERLTNERKGSLMRKTLTAFLTAGLAALLASVGAAASPQICFFPGARIARSITSAIRE